ncbi:MAG: hypothetical protein GXP47_03635 [Acidobacteria bacterium]|nr:hypothetical protein [Acidobacteriota bacterium]
MQRYIGRRTVAARGAVGRRLGALVLAGLFVGVLLASPASAFNIDSDQVVVPVIAHLPGLNGTQWRTDLWIQNVYSNPADLTLTYYPSGGEPLTATVHLDSYRGAHLHDVVLETFGLDNSKGMLVVSSAQYDVEVRARIYNTGNACGEFGQAVPGLPLGRLSRQGLLSGVSTAAGSRLSLGFANPTDHTIDISVLVYDAVTNDQIANESVEVGAHQLVQLDKLAERWNLPALDIITIRANCRDEDVVYAYASVVRNDTGDATFIFGTAPNTGPM